VSRVNASLEVKIDSFPVVEPELVLEKFYAMVFSRIHFEPKGWTLGYLFILGALSLICVKLFGRML